MVIYIIGGPGKTGSSTISHMLARDLNADHVYTGGLMREQAVQAHFIRQEENVSQVSLDMADVPAFRKHCMSVGRDIDNEVDLLSLGRIINAYEQSRALVVDSKLAAKLVNSSAGLPFVTKIKGFDPESVNSAREFQLGLQHNTHSVWLSAQFKVRALRALRKQYPSIEPDEAAIEAEATILKLRQLDDANAYQILYGILDYPVDDFMSEQLGFGTVIDNSNHSSIVYTYRQVLRALGVSIDI